MQAAATLNSIGEAHYS